MKKITFFTLHLGYGGVEKAVSSLASSLCDKYEVEIIATYKLFPNPAFKIDDRVSIKYLIANNLPLKLSGYRTLLKNHHYRTLLKAIWEDYLCKGKIISLIKDYRRGMNLLHKKEKRNIKEVENCRSDIIISTSPYLNSLVGKYASKNSLKIGWEHNHHNNNKRYIETIKKSSKDLDYFVVVSEKLANFYKDRLKCKVVGIPNFLDKISTCETSLPLNRVITVGRLSEEKGVIDLVRTFKLVHDVIPDIHYDIIGEGQERLNIEKEIKKLKLENAITIHGYQDQTYIDEYYKKSSLFLMGSFTESFGLVLAESMNYGVPCISFTSAEGANDLIINGVNGFLICNRDKNAMAKKIIEILRDPEYLKELSKVAKKTSNKFSKKEVIKTWKNLLEGKLI